MSKKYVFITGANTGIGLETIKALLQSSQAYHIYLGSRSVEKGKAAKADLEKEFSGSASEVEVVQIDITSDESINAAYEHVKNGPGYLDILVNNAGHAPDAKYLTGELTMREAWNQGYDTNVSGTQVITHVFAPLLLKSSDPRLMFITSGLSSLHGISQSYQPFSTAAIPAGWPKTIQIPFNGYRSSKAALNMMMITWYWILKEDGVKVWSISPGFLATGLGGVGKEELKARGAGDASLGGELIKKVIEGERDADVGKVVNSSGTQPL